MNRRKIVASVIGILILIGIVLWLLRPAMQKPQGPSSNPPVSTASPAQINNETPASSLSGKHPGITPEKIEAERAAAVTAAIESFNVPIDFWGKVVDQTGAPLSGVRVEYAYTTEHGTGVAVAWSAAEHTKRDAVTDNAGLFSVIGARGTYFIVQSLSKDGYVTSNRFPPSGMNYNFSGGTSEAKFVSNQSEPVLFVMLRNDAAESLVHIDVRLKLLGNGTPVRVNLKTGHQDINGELQFTLHRDPAVYISGPLKWDVKIEVLGGGVQEMNERNIASYFAPDNGYQSSGFVWTREGIKSVYFRTAPGNYGRLRIEIYPDDEGDSGRCIIDGYFNPSGSRNLEYTPAQNWIKPVPATNVNGARS